MPITFLEFHLLVMVAHEGFEPYVSSLKGLRLSLLDQWAIYWTNKRINHLVRERVPIPLILQGLCALTYTITSVYFALTELGTGLPEGTQTPDLALRRRLLYSAELLEDICTVVLPLVSIITVPGWLLYKRGQPP